MKHKIIKVRITFTEESLGTKAADIKLFETYIASKHPKGTPERDELESAERSEIAGTTGFHRDAAGNPIVMDYQMKGYFKESAKFMREVPGSYSGFLVGFKTKIDGLIFVNPRMIPMKLPVGETIGICERSLRADTPQGPRVALARSETVPAGTVMDFTVRSYVEKFKVKSGEKKFSIGVEAFIEEWLAYGADHGFGQWRNSGKGTFSYQILEVGTVEVGPQEPIAAVPDGGEEA